jgi:hypothetical protein
LPAGAIAANLSQAGDLIKIKKVSELRKNPSATSESFGKLPAGTVVTFEGQILKGFVSVSVELEDNSSRTGWVLEEELDLSADDAAAESLQKEEKAEGVVKRKKLRVPEDEQILIRRETTFFYGLQAGPNFSIISAASNGLYYNGIGFLGGGYLGTFLGKNFPGRIEVNFNQRNGANANDASTTGLSFGFLDVAAIGSYTMKAIELSGGLQYSFGLGLSQVPSGTVLQTAQDLSSAAFVLGAGYRFTGGQGLDYLVRLRYDLLFNQNVFTFQTIAVLFAL